MYVMQPAFHRILIAIRPGPMYTTFYSAVCQVGNFLSESCRYFGLIHTHLYITRLCNLQSAYVTENKQFSAMEITGALLDMFKNKHFFVLPENNYNRVDFDQSEKLNWCVC
jgi:hypothetical protein